MNLIKLTRPNDTKCLINTEQICMIRPNDGEFDDKAKSVIVVGGFTYGVKETMEEIWDLV